MFDNFDDVLTVEETAEALKLGTSHVYKLLRTKKLPGYKEGKDWKVPKLGLENYIRKKLNLPPVF